MALSGDEEESGRSEAGDSELMEPNDLEEEVTVNIISPVSPYRAQMKEISIL